MQATNREETNLKGGFVKARFWHECALVPVFFCSVVPFLHPRSGFGVQEHPVFVPSFRFWGSRNIRQNHSLGNHPSVKVARLRGEFCMKVFFF